ncbi:MAG: efflux transporter outer membrane subunit [Smithellaceae bacterium]
MKTKICILPAVMVFFLCSCTMAPDYVRPDAPVPENWPAYAKADTGAAAASELSWREFITDERLRDVIETALINNRDLRVSALNVERAKAMYGIGKVTLLPSVNATGAWYKERVPETLSTTGSAYTAEKFSVSLGITSWELDFFGRIRSLKDKALEEYLATDQAHLSSQILLIATVAQAYLTLGADREALQVVLETLEAQQETYNIIHKRYQAGMVSELDLYRAQSQLETAKGDAARYTQRVEQDENALHLLVGSSIRQDVLPRNLYSISEPRDLSFGLSSEKLLDRPDVLAAEHRLKAANANIGAARAAFFPRLSLTTAMGTASTDLAGLFKSGSGTWSFAPQIVLPIFDARTWYAYDVTKIEKEISIAQYEKAIQTAFREVADALAVKAAIDQQIEAQQLLISALSEAHRLSELRYTRGVDSYLAVLDAQRSLYGAKQGLILLRLARSSNLVTLYKALGGENNP